MAVITYEDVATAIGRPISQQAEQDQVSQWIADVEMLIGARLGDLSELDQTLLAYVVREAVIARMRHRDDNADSPADAVDSGNENYFLRILDPWWALLSPTEAATSSGAFSITPTRVSCMHVPWCSYMLGALYCSCGADIAGYPLYELS